MNPSTDISWLRRLISPSGLALVLLCLFFPFVGASCEGPMGTVDIHASGWDMVVNGEPSISGTGAFDRDEPGMSELTGESSRLDEREGAGVQPLLLVGVMVILAATVLGTVLQTAFARALGGLIAAAGALLLIVANEAVVLSTMQQEIEGSPFGISDADVAVGTRFGFWLTLALLAGVIADNVTELILSRRRPDLYRPPPGPPSAPPPGPQHAPPPIWPGTPPPPQRPYPGSQGGSQPPSGPWGPPPPDPFPGRGSPYGPPYG